MGEMEEELGSLKTKMEQLLREKQSYVDYIETLTLEKDEMIRTHTIETGELRKKVGVLSEHVERLESTSMAAAAAPQMGHAFSAGYGDLNDMDMTGAWDSANFLGGYVTEPDMKQDVSVMPTKKSENLASDESEKGASQGGLLFMLFLVGAFVMSRGSTPPMPRVSEDVRVASRALLENVFNDAGVGSQSHGLLQPMGPQPSGTASWAQPAAAAVAGGPMASGARVAPSMLEELGDTLTQPTEEQTTDQIFSMSAAQYNGVNSQDFLQHPPERSTSQGRKNLAEALASMRASNKQTGAAEVYTRSLLWDQIPRDVVKNFAKMVGECNKAQNEQQCNDTT